MDFADVKSDRIALQQRIARICNSTRNGSDYRSDNDNNNINSRNTNNFRVFILTPKAVEEEVRENAENVAQIREEEGETLSFFHFSGEDPPSRLSDLQLICIELMCL